MKSLTLIIFTVLAVKVSAQKELPNTNVEVISNFQAEIKDQNKKDLLPIIEAGNQNKTEQKYRLTKRQLEGITYEAPKIRPLAMKGEKQPKAYNGFGKIGYGIPNTPYLHAGYHYQNNDKYRIFGTAFHQSANNKSINNQKFSNTNIQIGGSVNTEMNIGVDAALTLQNNLFNFYSVDSLPNGIEPLRRFGNSGFQAKVYNTEETSWGINYAVGLRYNNLQTNFDTRENDFDLNIGMTKYFNDNLPFDIIVGTHITNLKDSTSSGNNNFYMKPKLTWTNDIARIVVGLNLVAVDDEFAVLPNIEGMIKISGNYIALYGGWEGDVRKNTYQYLSEWNPFIVERQELTNSKWNRFYGGLRGKIGRINYQGEASFKNINNMALFVNDSLRPWGFNVNYDQLQVFNLNGTLDIDLAKGLKFIGNIQYNVYTTDVERTAWQLPSLEANMGLHLTTMNDKMHIKAELYMADGLSYLDYQTDKIESQNLLFDLSFEAAYRFSEKFGVFFQVNNLPNNKYRRWYNTPTYGLNVLGGLTARF